MAEAGPDRHRQHPHGQPGAVFRHRPALGPLVREAGPQRHRGTHLHQHDRTGGAADVRVQDRLADLPRPGQEGGGGGGGQGLPALLRRPVQVEPRPIDAVGAVHRQRQVRQRGGGGPVHPRHRAAEQGHHPGRAAREAAALQVQLDLADEGGRALHAVPVLRRQQAPVADPDRPPAVLHRPSGVLRDGCRAAGLQGAHRRRQVSAALQHPAQPAFRPLDLQGQPADAPAAARRPHRRGAAGRGRSPRAEGQRLGRDLQRPRPRHRPHPHQARRAARPHLHVSHARVVYGPDRGQHPERLPDPHHADAPGRQLRPPAVPAQLLRAGRQPARHPRRDAQVHRRGADAAVNGTGGRRSAGGRL
ncbi:hypothetical protein MTBUT4_360025 [Magnetospirillum sp. UT-4]|nr:hypothetical protein MTBUT4_360025 [Magnetospirillum sp. UT-4]